MNDASTRVKVVPTCDKPLEQCAAANVLHLRLWTAAAPHTACVSGGALVNVLAGRICSVRQHAN